MQKFIKRQIFVTHGWANFGLWSPLVRYSLEVFMIHVGFMEELKTDSDLKLDWLWAWSNQTVLLGIIKLTLTINS